MKKNSLVLVFVFLLASCSFIDNGPSDQETQVLFEQYFQSQFPLEWAGSMAGGKLQELSITNVKRGQSIKSQNGGRLPEEYAAQNKDCWPVSMHVKGTAMANLFLTSRINEFEEDAKFMLCKSYEENSWTVKSDKMMTSSR